MLVRQKFDGPGMWHTRNRLQQDAQKCRPARPQRVKGRGYPLGYVEGLNDARTTLADFFSILASVCLAVADRSRPPVYCY